jgi:peptidoglycan/LPS O-acetylase OafA/YrhL
MRYKIIDSLRAVAATAVVFFHAFGADAIYLNLTAQNLLNIWPALYFFPAIGFSGVYLFFVISGFCIHLRRSKKQVAGEDHATINFRRFWIRRWKRLYPAYLATMGLFMGWAYWHGTLTVNAFFWWDLISHVLMIHNLDSRTVYSFNRVLWTLAIEEQLYLLYFLLLYLRDRLGWAWTLAITFAARFLWLGLTVLVLRYCEFNLPFQESAVANWFIWTLGALGIEAYLGLIKLPRIFSSLRLAAVLILICSAMRYFTVIKIDPYLDEFSLLFEPCLWGVAFFVLINGLMRYEYGLLRSPAIARQAIGFLAFIGLSSYSLYLTHELILELPIGVPLAISLLLCYVFAYLFFLVFERPFIAKTPGPVKI